MKELPVSLLLALGLPALAADPPSKRGLGFFGFGAPPADQISSDLFPQSETPPASGPAMSSPDGIFRGGQPQSVEPVSYVIENGRRIERPVQASLKKPGPPAPAQPPSLPAPAAPKPMATAPSVSPPNSPVADPALPNPAVADKKRAPWFGFGKRDEPDATENPAVPPVPAATPVPVAPPASSTPALVAKPDTRPAPVPAKPLENPLPSLSTPSQNAETPDFANVKDEKDEKDEKGGKFGWIPFVGRKKDIVPIPALPEGALVAAPIAAGKPGPGLVPKPAAPAPKPAESKTGGSAAAGAGSPTVKPGDTPASPEVATFEIRRDESKPVEPEKKEKPDRDGGLLNPIAKIRPPRKEIDLTGAETIIQDGVIVGGTDPLSAAVQTDTTAPRQAPQVVNGVKTYSSWNDVDARSASAAEKIISRIR
jgi:hypothetical protein